MFSLFRIALLALALALTGCSNEVVESEAVESSEAAIFSGVTVTDYPAAVSLYDFNCTGALIAPDAVITSARCLYHLGQGAVFTLNAWVMIDGIKKWTTGVPARIRWASTFRYPNDSASDFAIITLLDGATFNLGSPGVCDYNMRESRGKPSCYLRVYADALGTTRNYKVYARGANDRYGGGVDVMRRGDLYMDDWSDDRHYFFSEGNRYLHDMCVGDYGGPAAVDKVALNTPYEMLLGTVSTFDLPSGSLKNCTIARERFNRTGTKVALIDEALYADFGRTCLRQSSRDAANRVYYFYKCW